jgi:hypothetical protein
MKKVDYSKEQKSFFARMEPKYHEKLRKYLYENELTKVEWLQIQIEKIK